MEGNYPVSYQEEPVGKVQLLKKGLYYSVEIRCRRVTQEICRVAARWPGGWENLGIPVPEGDGLRLAKKIPVKRMGEGPWEFLLIPADLDIEEALREKKEPQLREEPVRAEPQTEKPVSREEEPPVPQPNPEEEIPATVEQFLPIASDMPFDRLDLLEQGVLGQRDGQTGLLVQMSSDSPTGQWSEPIISE